MILRLTYFVLFFTMILCLYIGGKGIKQHNRYCIIIAILAFSLNEGLRFGRWIDYNNFAIKYKSIINQTLEVDYLYSLLCRVSDSIGIGFQGMIFFQSLMHVIAAVYFFRLYKDVAKYALPLYGLFTYQEAENIMRWNLAFAFVLMGLYHFFTSTKNSRKYFLMGTFIIIALNIHLGLIIVLPIFFAFLFIKRPIAVPWISITLYFLIAFTFQTEYMTRLVDLVNYFSVTFSGGQYEGYVINSEYWLTSSALGVESTRSFPPLPTLLVYITSVWLGYRLIPLFGKAYLYAYNLFLFGFIFNSIAFKLEIFSRVNYLFILFVAVVFAYVVKYSRFAYRSSFKYVSIFTILVLLNYFRMELSLPFRRKTDQLLYVWDKKGRKYLDNETVYFHDMYNSKDNK